MNIRKRNKMAFREQNSGSRLFPGTNEALPVQTPILGQQQMMYNPQLPQQMYNMHPGYSLQQTRFYSQTPSFQPPLLGTFRPVVPIAGQVASDRGTMATNIQSVGIVAPDSGKYLEEQKKLERERNFQLQQQRLKQFNVANRRSNLNSTQYLENLFGTKTEKQHSSSSLHTTVATKVDQENYKSLPQKCVSNQELVSPVFKEGKQKENQSLPETAFKQSVKNTKALDNMMSKCVNLNGPHKANTFQKPSVKDIQPTLQHTASFSASEKACDWNRVQINELQDMFTLPKPRFPKWCCKEFVPPIYHQIEQECTNQGNHAIDTTLLYPILTSSGLQREILGQIWELCNQTNPGQLTSEELYAILSLIGLAQMGHAITSTDILHSIPQPVIPVLQYFVLPVTSMNTLSEEQNNLNEPVLETQVPTNDSIAANNQTCNVLKSLTEDSSQSNFNSAEKITDQKIEQVTEKESDSVSDDAHDFGDFKSATVFTEETTKVPSIQTIDNTVDDFDDFKQAPVISSKKMSFVANFPTSQETKTKQAESDLMSPDEDKYSIFRALQENTQLDTSSWGFDKNKKTEIFAKSKEKSSNNKEQSSEKVSNATVNVDDDFGDFLSADATNVEPIKDEFPGFESYDATNSDDFGNFASFQTDTIPVVTVSDKNGDITTFPNPSQIMTSEIVLNIQSKDSISLAESQSVSSLEFGTFDGIASGCHSRESQSSLSRHGSIPSLNFKASGIESSLSRQGSVRSLDLKGSSLDNTDEFGEMQSFATSRKISSHSHSPSPSFDLAKNTEEELPSQPVVVENSVVQSTIPFTITDRYSFIRLNGSANVEDLHVSEWMKCLESCHNLIHNATDIFNQMNSSTVCNKVIGTEEGSNYVKNLVEVYKVVNRIATSAKSSGKQTDRLRQLLQDIEHSWNSITVFISSSSILPEEKLLDFSSCILQSEPENLQKACGICLLNVDAKNTLHEVDKDCHKLTYGGRQYHATCANFWVNCVDPLLPSLPFPHLL
ncbi:synergin gamma-like isoform X3 [Centruroides sculpturatus]|uniref:synergin gamma-like isoform X3 n=1 Tax=Centruroides sculpturatus TaxID=218467 RepID=UPI000C6D4DC8|nr:synergin gamma-like isoform X3 [Centruroides sculpturatus]